MSTASGGGEPPGSEEDRLECPLCRDVAPASLNYCRCGWIKFMFGECKKPDCPGYPDTIVSSKNPRCRRCGENYWRKSKEEFKEWSEAQGDDDDVSIISSVRSDISASSSFTAATGQSRASSGLATRSDFSRASTAQVSGPSALQPLASAAAASRAAASSPPADRAPPASPSAPQQTLETPEPQTLSAPPATDPAPDPPSSHALSQPAPPPKPQDATSAEVTARPEDAKGPTGAVEPKDAAPEKPANPPLPASIAAAPEAPAAIDDSVEKVEPVESVEPVEPDEPVEPVEPVEPTEDVEEENEMTTGSKGTVPSNEQEKENLKLDSSLPIGAESQSSASPEPNKDEPRLPKDPSETEVEKKQDEDAEPASQRPDEGGINDHPQTEDTNSANVEPVDDMETEEGAAGEEQSRKLDGSPEMTTTTAPEETGEAEQRPPDASAEQPSPVGAEDKSEQGSERREESSPADPKRGDGPPEPSSGEPAEKEETGKPGHPSECSDPPKERVLGSSGVPSLEPRPDGERVMGSSGYPSMTSEQGPERVIHTTTEDGESEARTQSGKSGLAGLGGGSDEDGYKTPPQDSGNDLRHGRAQSDIEEFYDAEHQEHDEASVRASSGARLSVRTVPVNATTVQFLILVPFDVLRPGDGEVLIGFNSHELGHFNSPRHCCTRTFEVAKNGVQFGLYHGVVEIPRSLLAQKLEYKYIIQRNGSRGKIDFEWLHFRAPSGANLSIADRTLWQPADADVRPSGWTLFDGYFELKHPPKIKHLGLYERLVGRADEIRDEIRDRCNIYTSLALEIFAPMRRCRESEEFWMMREGGGSEKRTEATRGGSGRLDDGPGRRTRSRKARPLSPPPHAHPAPLPPPKPTTKASAKASAKRPLQDSSSDSDSPSERRAETKADGPSAEKRQELYQLLLDSEQDPTPRGRFVLVTQDQPLGAMSTLPWATNHLNAHPQDHLAIKIGVHGRPIFIIWCAVKKTMYLPHMVAMDTGDVTARTLWEVGYCEDAYQPNKPVRPSPVRPNIGRHKALLTVADCEYLRKFGPALLVRGKELQRLPCARRKSIILAPPAEASAHASFDAVAAADFPPAHLLFYLDDAGEFVYTFSRLSTVPNGSALTDSITKNQVTIRLAELEKLVGWLDAIFVETARLAACRVAVSRPLSEDLRNFYAAKLEKWLLEKGVAEEVETEELVDWVATAVRGTSSDALQDHIFSYERGCRGNFQAFHMDMCRRRNVKMLAEKLRRSIQDN